MNDLTKDEVVRLAREAGYRADAKMHDHDYDLFLNFYTLCRADLVAENAVLKQAHEINADTLNAMQVEIDDWKARALKAEQAGDRAVPDAEDYDLIDRYLRNNLDDADYGEYLAALDRLVTPQPAAQEPTSAVPVVRQMVVALDLAAPYFTHNNHVTAALVAGRQYLEENGK